MKRVEHTRALSKQRACANTTNNNVSQRSAPEVFCRLLEAWAGPLPLPFPLVEVAARLRGGIVGGSEGFGWCGGGWK